MTPALFRDELSKVSGNLTVWLNSPGGDVFAASQIYSMLKNHKGKVTVKIDGIAASAASVVAMAGDETLIAPTAMMMIHDPSTSAMGNKADMEKAIELLEEVKESIINAYETKSHLSRNKIAKLMSDETWLNAKKAHEMGFVDGILFVEKKKPFPTKEEEEPDEGTIKWGVSTSRSYFPIDNSAYFNDNDESIVDWIRKYSTSEVTDTYLRGFLGKMLFSGDEIYKPVKVLSGGEKVRCMFSRMMLFGSNVIMLDRPTNHLDLESITAVNNGLRDFKGVVIFASHDHEIVQTVANRIIEITPDGCIDRQGTYEEFLDWRRERGMKSFIE